MLTPRQARLQTTEDTSSVAVARNKPAGLVDRAEEGMADTAWAELLARAGHDVRAPVASIIHYTSAELAAARLDAAQAQVILAESQRALAALDQVMACLRGHPVAPHPAVVPADARPQRAAQARQLPHLQPWLPRNGGAGARASLGRCCVWVAEDCEIAAAVLLTLLREAGCEVLHFEDGLALVKQLADEDVARPALVATDFKMPGLDGPNVLRAVQARWPGLPVVCLTARDDARALAAAGFAAVLVKPVTACALEPVLARLTRAPAVAGDAAQAIPPDAPAAAPCLEPAMLTELSTLARLGAISDLLERSGEFAALRPDWQPLLSRLSALAGLGDLEGCLRLLRG